MNNQDARSYLSVQKFLRLCNWEGQPLDNRECQHQDQSLLASWQCLSVEKFFNRYNWEGQREIWIWGEREIGRTSQSRTFTELPPLLGQTDWQYLSVKEFFRLCSWEGQPLENQNCRQLDPRSHLKQQVRKFFQFIPWEGNPEIGILPKVSSLPPLPGDDVELTFTDLSDLF